MRFLIYIFLFALFPHTNVLFAQTAEIGLPFITNYKLGDYEAHSQNWDIDQDNRGILFIANGEGVLTYDGSNWETIPVNNKKTVRCVEVDNNGIVYVGGDNYFGKLNITDQGKYEYLSLSNELNNIVFRNVRYIDFANEGIYFMSRSHLFFLHQDSISYVAAPSNFINMFKLNNQLFVVDEKSGAFTLNKIALEKAPVGEMLVKKGLYLIGTYNNKVYFANRDNGLFEYSPFSKNPDFKIIPGEISSVLNKKGVYKGTITHDGKLIIATWSEGIIIGNTDGSYSSNITVDQGLLSNNILSVFIDKTQNLWLGLNSGISRCDISYPISHWNETNGLKGLVNDVVRFNRTLYVGSHQGLHVYENNQLKQKYHTRNEVWQFLAVKLPKTDDSVLLAGTSDGIIQINNNGIKFLSPDFTCFSLYQSKRNPEIVYIGGTSYLHLLRFSNGVFSYMGKIHNSFLDVRSIAEDEYGDIWLTTFRNGAIRIKPGTQLLIPEQIDTFGYESGLPSLKNVKVFESSSGLLFGTEQGLYRYSEQKNQFEPYEDISVDFFHSNRDIFSFNEEENGQIFSAQLFNREGSIGIATPDSSGKYNWNTEIFNRIPKMMVLGFYVEKNTVWIGGTEGLFKVDINERYVPKFKSQTLIRKIKTSADSTIFYGNFTENASKRGITVNHQKPEDIPELKYENRNIAIHYSNPNYSELSHIKYQFKLTGLDMDWSPWTTSTFKEFANLNEGNYTFLVRSNLEHDAQIASYSFKIHPPWYRTFFAYIVFVFIALLFIGLIIKLNNRQLRKRNSELEKTVKERTRELELQNAELQKLSIIARETDNAIIITDTNGKINWINQGFTQLYGYTLNELENNHIDNIKHLSHKQEITELFEICINEKKSVSYDSLNFSKEGKQIWARTYLTPILNTNNNVIQVVGIDSDITSLKLAEQEILKQKDEVQAQRDFAQQQKEFIEQQNKELQEHRNHLEKLVSERTADLEIAKAKAIESDRLKSSFLANMSHEIRTPMNAIIGFSDLLSQNDLSDFERKDLINHIVYNSYGLLHLIEDIIDIAKIESGQMEIKPGVCDINDVMERVFNEALDKKNIQFKDELHITMHTDELPGNIQFICDPKRVKQVLEKLVDNAIKFTDKGNIRFGYTVDNDNDQVVFYIEDSGIGLSDEQQKNIFKRFTKVEDGKRKLYRGAGLGLAICKSLVEQMHGEIWVKSQENQGSTFYFYMPINFKPVEMNDIQKTDSHSEPGDWSSKTVLIAEDEDSNYNYLKMALRKTGIQIIRAANGKEAIDMVRNQHIDLILMDIKMPEMDGNEATQVIKSEFPHMPIIAQTAYAMSNDREECLKAGCDNYISKPINKTMLIRMLSNYI